jgi:hypothetical protein
MNGFHPRVTIPLAHQTTPSKEVVSFMVTMEGEIERGIFKVEMPNNSSMMIIDASSMETRWAIGIMVIVMVGTSTINSNTKEGDDLQEQNNHQYQKTFWTSLRHANRIWMRWCVFCVPCTYFLATTLYAIVTK